MAVATRKQPKRGRRDPQGSLWGAGGEPTTDRPSRSSDSRPAVTRPAVSQPPKCPGDGPPSVAPPTEVRLPDRSTPELTKIEAAWLDFHEAHPLIANHFITEAVLAYEAKLNRGVDPGRVRLSAKRIWEALRDKFDGVPAPDGQAYGLNNNFTPYYARLAERIEPRLRGCFAKRKTAKET